jgi:hypothetical protein
VAGGGEAVGRCSPSAGSRCPVRPAARATQALRKPTLIDLDPFISWVLRFGISGQMLQNIALGGAMITIPIYPQMVLEYNALQAGTPAPLVEHVRGGDPYRQAVGQSRLEQHHQVGFAPLPSA